MEFHGKTIHRTAVNAKITKPNRTHSIPFVHAIVNGAQTHQLVDSVDKAVCNILYACCFTLFYV